MKKRNLVAICLVCLSFVGCSSFHTGKVVVDDEKKEDKVENVEYILVDEDDKESLIKNIKEFSVINDIKIMIRTALAVIK